jgi:hypothetical protein
MKTKRTLAIAALGAMAALTSIGIWRGTRGARAQDQIPPPVGELISFGSVGITQGQTIRLSVVAIPYDSAFPPGPTRVVLTFFDAEGRRLLSRNGSIIRQAVDLEPGKTTFLDLNADNLQTPPPIGDRLQLRAIVNVIPPPVDGIPPPIPDRIVATVEVINHHNGPGIRSDWSGPGDRTAFVLTTAPSVQRMDPPPMGD